MKVFLSHKMTGLTEEEVMKIRNEALEYLQETYGEIELIDNYHHKDVPENAGRLWHLGTSIRMMEEADAVYFCDGWEEAKGCCIEYEICKMYNNKILSRNGGMYMSDMHTDNHMNSYSSFDECVKKANNSCLEDTVSNVAVKVTELLSRTVIVKAKDYSEAKAKVEEAYQNGNLQLGANDISVELELKDDTEKYINIFGKEEFESMEVSEEFLHL